MQPPACSLACCAKGLPSPSSAPGTACTCPSKGVETAPGQCPGQERVGVPRGDLCMLRDGEERSWRGTRPHGSADTRRSPVCPQPQQDLRPPAWLSPPHCVIYGLCAGRQMVKENRAGGSRWRGAACTPRRGERGRLLPASGTGGQQTSDSAGARQHSPPCHGPSSDKPWLILGERRGGTHQPMAAGLWPWGIMGPDATLSHRRQAPSSTTSLWGLQRAHCILYPPSQPLASP